MSDSRSRVRTNALNIRLFDHERAYLDELAAPTGLHAADLVRAYLFGYPVHHKPRCSDHHPTCDAHHHEMVQSYRLTRHQQEIESEYLHMNGERAFFQENGQRLVSFADWLRSQNSDQPPGEQESGTGG